MNCVTCEIEENKRIDATYIYAGDSLCLKHFREIRGDES